MEAKHHGAWTFTDTCWNVTALRWKRVWVEYISNELFGSQLQSTEFGFGRMCISSALNVSKILQLPSDCPPAPSFPTHFCPPQGNLTSAGLGEVRSVAPIGRTRFADLGPPLVRSPFDALDQMCQRAVLLLCAGSAKPRAASNGISVW